MYLACPGERVACRPTRCRHPARGWGSNHFRQMRQGRLRLIPPWLNTGARFGHQNTARLQWNYVEYFSV